MSFDKETAGDSCGIVQISTQVFRMVHRNVVMESEIKKETFNNYVQPGKEAIWYERVYSIVNADGSDVVWKDF